MSKHQGFQNKLYVDNKIYFNIQGNSKRYSHANYIITNI